MELTRRDALAALSAAGIAVGGAAALRWGVLPGDAAFDERERETLAALAAVLYPSTVDASPAFVEIYVVGRVRDRPAYAEGMQDALATLDERARAWFGDRFAALSPSERDDVLRQLGVDVADADPSGLAPGRVRYYLVDELLYALYTSPTGGELVGIENPIGHPGGLASYRRPPESQRGDDDG